MEASMIRWRNWLPIAFCLGLMPPAAGAMEFRAENLPDNKAMIEMTGRIVIGDDRRLHEFVGGLPGHLRVVGVALDSLGGNLYEASLMARTLRGSGVTTGVRARASCASACFLIFAAGTKR